ncbi:hypothetical protein [Mesorhizobium prunaredense]|uniref:hypothetical protein n=1 Tax=Mesorhizobium prunaredense TaxID=1631249 RepID=UPI00117E1D5E|nr:hypothetical protein [Mesorhizobium prunaredense]
MTKRLQIGLIGITLIVTGCTTATPPAGGNRTSSIVSDATAQARSLCAFVPTAETILALIATGQPQLTIAAGIAKAICNAVVPKPGSAPGTPTVAGVVIKGSFER